MDHKALLRREALARRRGSTDIGKALASHGMGLALSPGAVVAGYWPFRDEADPRQLMLAMAARGHPLALPRLAGRGLPLSFRLWRVGDALVVHNYGMMEPDPESPVAVPSVLLVPLLAFDAAGYRLGYGGGYYDRTLAALRAHGKVLAIGIAYAVQEVDAVPHDDSDQRLDAVLTEKGLQPMTMR